MVSVISLSLDGSMLTEDGESRTRQRKYATHFDQYTVICKTDAEGYEPIESGALRLVPTNSRTRYGYVLKTLYIGLREAWHREYSVVTSQDPFVLGALAWLLSQIQLAAFHVQIHIDFLNNRKWLRESPTHRLFHPLGKLVVRAADRVRVGTEHEKEKIQSRFGEDVDVRVAPVRMDFSELIRQFSPTERDRIYSSQGIPRDRSVVLFTGRFVLQKDLPKFVAVAEQAIEAAEEPLAFVLVGDGPEHDRIVELTNERGLSDYFHFPGWVEFADLPIYYDIADIFLITSIYEGTSRVIIEAGMNEVPVVATPFAGARDNVRDSETGFIADDVSALADRVLRLVRDPSKRMEMGKSSRTFLAERFEPERLTREYVAFLRPEG
jgi:glycosyltransferase involved in cell wall biosynthesis